MKKYQKLLLIFLSVVLVFSICSCDLLDALTGNTETTTTNNGTPAGPDNDNGNNGTPADPDNNNGGNNNGNENGNNKPVDPNPETVKWNIGYTYTDIAGDSLHKTVTVTLAKDETLTVKAFVESYCDIASFENSLKNGEWTLNGNAVTDGAAALADGDALVYRVTSENADTVLRDPENPVAGAGEVVFSMSYNGTISAYWANIGDDLITVSELYDQTLADDLMLSFDAFHEIFDLICVDGESASGSTPISAGNIVTAEMSNAGDFEPEEPGDGEITVTMIIVEENSAVKMLSIVNDDSTLADLAEAYFMGSFDYLSLIYKWAVDGEEADGDTVLTDGCLVYAEFSLPEGMIEIQFEVSYGGTPLFSQPYYVEGPSLTLKSFYDIYLGDGESLFEDTLSEGSWTVNGEAADGDTVLMEGALVTYLVTDIGGGDDSDGYYVTVTEEDGDDWSSFDLFVEGTEYLTVKEIYDLYLEDYYEMTFEEMCEMFVLFVDDEEATGDTVVQDWQYITFSYLDGYYQEPGDGEIIIYYEYYNSYWETWYGSAAILPKEGVTLADFHSLYMTFLGLNEVPFEDFEWHIYESFDSDEDEYVIGTADMLISGEVYVWCTDAEQSGDGDKDPDAPGDDDGYYVYYQDWCGDDYMKVSYFVTESNALTLEVFFRIYIGEEDLFFEDVCDVSVFYVNGQIADADTIVTPESIVTSYTIGVDKQEPADGEMKVYVTYYDHVEDIYLGMAFVMPEEEITLKAFYETYLSDGAETFEESCSDFKWSVNKKVATADTVLTANCEIFAYVVAEWEYES